MLFQYLQEHYAADEPIFIGEIHVKGLNRSALYYQMKQLTDAGFLKRFDRGIYYIPNRTFLKSGSQLSAHKVIEKKYLFQGCGHCGYLSGLMFANQIGLTTQVPMLIEVVSNKASQKRREILLGNTRLLLRKPCVPITEQNYRILQFLDLMIVVDQVCELEEAERSKMLKKYLEKAHLNLSMFDEYTLYYPKELNQSMCHLK